MRRSVSNSQRSGKYPIENWDAKKTLKNIARVCSERSFSHVALHVRKASKEQKSAKKLVCFAVSGNGRGPGAVREGPGRRSGEGPERVRKVLRTASMSSYIRHMSESRPRIKNTCVNRVGSEPMSGQNWQITVSCLAV